jgi:hypothetical protein
MTQMLPTPRAAEEVSKLMMRFAERTGLTSDVPKQRYTNLALRLVDQVHHVLGTYRADDSRTGQRGATLGSHALTGQRERTCVWQREPLCSTLVAR